MPLSKDGEPAGTRTQAPLITPPPRLSPPRPQPVRLWPGPSLHPVGTPPDGALELGGRRLASTPSDSSNRGIGLARDCRRRDADGFPDFDACFIRPFPAGAPNRKSDALPAELRARRICGSPPPTAREKTAPAANGRNHRGEAAIGQAVERRETHADAIRFKRRATSHLGRVQRRVWSRGACCVNDRWTRTAGAPHLRPVAAGGTT